MVLKAVELFGFKSFADRSKIEFRGGISALLGPNGCGKSNVVDAVKWVLGEQSSKSLRAEKMEDVIFNGTESRKMLNVAEVTLILSNEESIFPVDLAEVSIKRRIHRSGESQYFINDAPVRLKEVREMFFDTGVGKSAYSIMEQGKIDQILSNKPEERRNIFEEAAGITKYKIRGAEAERKLEKTEDNMSQVENILKEVKRSHDSLKIQAEKTEGFRAYQEQIFQLELDITLLKMKEFLENQNRKEEHLEKKKAERDDIRKKINDINSMLEQNLDLVNTMETELVENQKRIYGYDLEKSSKENQIQLLGEREREIAGKIETDRKLVVEIDEKIQQLIQQQGEKQETLLRLNREVQENENNIAGFEQNITNSEHRVTENENKIEQNDKTIEEFEGKQEELQQDLRLITDDIVTQLDAKLKETGYSYRERNKLEEEIERELQSLGISIRGKLNILGDLSALESKNRKEIERVLLQSSGALAESIEALQAIHDSFLKYKQAVPSFLDEFLSPEGIITKKRGIDAELEEIRKSIGTRREENRSFSVENRDLGVKIQEYRKTLEELRMNSVRMNTQKNNIEDNLQTLEVELGEQNVRLQRNKEEIESGEERLKQLKKKVEILEQEKAGIAAEEAKLKTELTRLEESIHTRNKDLIDKEKKMKDHMRKSDEIQQHIEKIQMECATIETEIKNLYENFEDKYSRDLSDYEEKIYEIKAPKNNLRDELKTAKEKQKALGQINLMAPEEFKEVKERYDFLTGQLKDLRDGYTDLKKITRQIRAESEELFIDTYEKIKKNFHSLFRRLFGGGRAELSLSDPDNILESGIEIYAQPPGKKLENIALLSGGERSLTAVALLFSMYMVRPSPFCILDEIDAALDEHNVGRFVHLLEEFSINSQFVIITHNKKTVAGAHTLLGITMAESGVSKIVSIRLDRNQEDVTAG